MKMDLYDLRILFTYRHVDLIDHDQVAAYCGMDKRDMMALRQRLVDSGCLRKGKTYRVHRDKPWTKAHIYAKGAINITTYHTTDKGVECLVKLAEWYDPETPVKRDRRPQWSTETTLRRLRAENRAHFLYASCT